MSKRSSGEGSRGGSDVAKKLVSLINAALHTKGGKVSASKISAVSDCALKLYKRHSKEVVATLIGRMKTCEDSKRLVSIYIIDSVIMRSHKKLGNSSYPKLLQSQLWSVFELVSYASSKDKKQIGKVLGKFRDNNIYPESVVNEWATAARVSLPKAGQLALKRSDSISSRGTTASTSKEKPVRIEPRPPRDPPPAPKPPPVTLSLGSKRSAEETSKQPPARSLKRIKEDEELKAKEAEEAKEKQKQEAMEREAISEQKRANPGGWGKFFGQTPQSSNAPTTQSAAASSSSATTSGWGNFNAQQRGPGVQSFSPPRGSVQQSGWGSFKGHASTQGSSGSPPQPYKPYGQGQGQRPPAPFPRGPPPPRAAFPRGFPPPDMTRPPPRGYSGGSSSYPPRQPGGRGYPPRGQQPYAGSTQGMFQGVPKRASSSNGWDSVGKK